MRRFLALVVLGVMLAFARPVQAQTTQFVSPAKSTASWTSGTANNTAVTVASTGHYSQVMVTLSATSTMTAGTLNFEADDGAGTWFAWPCTRVGGASAGALETSYALTPTTQVWSCSTGPMTSFRVRLSPAITGSGTASVGVLPTASPVDMSGDSNPCLSPLATTVAISQVASTQIVTGVTGQKVFICHMTWLGADTEQVSVVEGTGTTCATGTAAMYGATTAANGSLFGASGGIVLGDGAAWVLRTATAGDNVCLLQSGTGRVSGSIKYVIQ